MPNTKSAAKALRQSKRKREHNLFWKRRITAARKTLRKMLEDNGDDILEVKKQEVLLQKVLDKAAKNKVIHKNKARRLKSRFAKKIASYASTKGRSAPGGKAAEGKSAHESKQKSRSS